MGRRVGRDGVERNGCMIKSLRGVSLWEREGKGKGRGHVGLNEWGRVGWSQCEGDADIGMGSSLLGSARLETHVRRA